MLLRVNSRFRVEILRLKAWSLRFGIEVVRLSDWSLGFKVCCIRGSGGVIAGAILGVLLSPNT